MKKIHLYTGTHTSLQSKNIDSYNIFNNFLHSKENKYFDWFNEEILYLEEFNQHISFKCYVYELWESVTTKEYEKFVKYIRKIINCDTEYFLYIVDDVEWIK